MTSVIVLKCQDALLVGYPMLAILIPEIGMVATHLSLGSEQERTQFLGPSFLVILLHVELITIGMKSRWGLRDPKEGCTPLTSTQKKPWNESQNRKENGKDLRYCVTQYFHLTLPCHGKIVNQQPPVHHEGWWMASVVTHQFSAGFHFPS